jgi:VanZ family protein
MGESPLFCIRAPWVGTTKGDAAKETLFFSANWSEFFLLVEAFNETARRAARFNEVLRWICHATGEFGYALVRFTTVFTMPVPLP